MLYDLFFTVRGPNGNERELPNECNPVKVKSMAILMLQLPFKLPNVFPAKIVGIRVKETLKIA